MEMNMKSARGGNPELEQQHAKILLEGGEKEIWGWGSPAGKVRVQNRVNWFTDVCGLRPGVRVLECGCGVGVFTRELAKTGADITAVDIAEPLLERARQECQSPNIQFIQDNLEDPNVLPKESFDVICGVSILHHLNMVNALSALRGLAAPGAKFAFSEPNLLNPINRYYMFVDDAEKRRQRGISPTEMAFRPRELAEYFSTAGYTIEQLHMKDFVHPAIPGRFVGVANTLGAVAEKMPLIRLWSGSIWISGRV